MRLDHGLRRLEQMLRAGQSWFEGGHLLQMPSGGFHVRRPEALRTALGRAVQAERIPLINVAPAYWEIRLSRVDWEGADRLYGVAALTADLNAYLVHTLRELGCTTNREPAVRVLVDQGLTPSRIRVSSDVSHEDSGEVASGTVRRADGSAPGGSAPMPEGQNRRPNDLDA